VNDSKLNVNLKFEQLSSLDFEVKKTVGIIESATVLNSRVFAVLRKTANTDNINYDPGEGSPLYNNILNMEESKLTPFELLIPIKNIDMLHIPIDMSTFIGKFAIVYERSGIAFEAEYLGELWKPSDDASIVASSHIRSARVMLSAMGQADDVEAVKDKMKSMYGYDDSSLNSTFQYNFLSDFQNHIVTWAGESYSFKDVDEQLSYENKLTPVDILKYLNKTPMKTKKCHLPNLPFSGR
jgi:hypothetical protein